MIKISKPLTKTHLMVLNRHQMIEVVQERQEQAESIKRELEDLCDHLDGGYDIIHRQEKHRIIRKVLGRRKLGRDDLAEVCDILDDGDSVIHGDEIHARIRAALGREVMTK